MALEVLVDNKFNISKDLILSLKNAANLTLSEESIDESVVNLKIIDNFEMQELNKEFRNKDKTTNVLSF